MNNHNWLTYPYLMMEIFEMMILMDLSFTNLVPLSLAMYLLLIFESQLLTDK